MDAFVSIARAAAVLGDGAQLRVAADLAGVPVDDAERAADGLAEAGLLARSRPLRFVDPAVRDAVYRDMPPGERAIAHRRAVRLLAGSGAAAVHALAVEPAGDEAVAAALVVTGRSALAAGRPELAARLLERALREPPPSPWRAAARALLGIALSRLGDRRAVALLREAGLRAELADALWLCGDAAGALEAIGSTPPGIAAAVAARDGSLEASTVVSLALDGLRGATAFERWHAIAALIACDEPAAAADALSSEAAAARARGARAELEAIARLWLRLEGIARGLDAPAAAAPDPGAAPWEGWDGDAISRFGTASARAFGLRREGDIASLERAVTVLRSSPRRVLLADTLLSLGRALRHAGRRAAARVALREALDIAQRLGLDAVAEQAGDELRVAGARPRREFLSGPDSLTAAERRVADAAAQGLSNRDIAARLFLSPKTVEMHLGRVYRKLDIGSRAEVALSLAA